MDTESPGQLAHALDGPLASLANDVRCAELFGERDPVGMPAQKDDPRISSENPARAAASQPCFARRSVTIRRAER